jgi:hypothetical protein
MINAETQLAGQYKYQITRANGQIEESPWMNNLITDNGLNMLGESSATVFDALQVGTGTNAVAASQSTLTQFLKATALSFVGTVRLGGAAHKSEHTYKAIFPQGDVVGIITELGVGRDTTGDGNIFSRALVVDANDVPTSMTIVALDQLTVFYKIIVTPPLNTVTGSFDIAGVTYNYTARVAAVDSFSGGQYFQAAYYFGRCNYAQFFGTDAVLGSILETLTGSGGSAGGSMTDVSYTPATHTRVSKITVGITEGNIEGGIQGIAVYFQQYACQFQFVLDKPIPKTNTKTLTLDVSFSWGRG